MPTEKWDSKSDIYAMHWSFSIASAHNTVHEELDITNLCVPDYRYHSA
jgi:hypothetical protein